MTGVLTLTSDRDGLHQRLNTRLDTPASVIASDAYASLLGALNGEPGGIVAVAVGAGTCPRLHRVHPADAIA